MATKVKSIPKPKKRISSGSELSESVGSDGEGRTPQKPTKGSSKGRKPSVDATPTSLAAGEFITSAFNGDMLMNLVNLADARDGLVREAPAGFFPDVVSGSVDMSMAIAETMLKFTDSLDKDARSSQDIFTLRVHEFIISVMDAVYGPNCVRITLYNPDVDWTISLWHMLHVEDNSPSDRVFSSQIPSQAEASSQWIDLKNRLISYCRNPKREIQQAEHIASLEHELEKLNEEYSSILEKMNQPKDSDDVKPSKRMSSDSKSPGDSVARCREIVLHKHRVFDPESRSKRDAILWGGQPHLVAASNSAIGVVGKTKRRLSRFGFKSEEEYMSSDSSSEGAAIPTSPQDVNKPSEPNDNAAEDGMNTPPAAAKNVGCLSVFRCCSAKPNPKSKATNNPRR